jgi:nucleotide-binding universal stress UspA family protein
MGVIVMTRDAGSCAAPAVRWAQTGASVRQLPLQLLHVWSLPVDVSVDLPADIAEAGAMPMSVRAVGGPMSRLLASLAPELLVLAGDLVTTRAVRMYLHAVPQPTVVVPASHPPETGVIVVGLCGTSASAAALDWAAREAAARGARLVVMHAWQFQPHSVAELLAPSRALAAQDGQAVNRLHGWVGDRGDLLDLQVCAAHGAPLDLLVKAAAEADLLVIGSPRHGMLAHVTHSELGIDLVGLVDCPVAFVPCHVQ